MMLARIAIRLVVVFVLAAGARAQAHPGSIVMAECRNCDDIIERPEAKYPPYVGYGAHNVGGVLGVEVLINNDGHIISAKAIFGHPYFRPLLERASSQARFTAVPHQPPDTKRKAIFVFRITPPFWEPTGVINGRASVLQKPEYTEELRTLCASGEVKIKVLIGEKGDVLEANAVSGDELLYETALSAVDRSTFQPLPTKPVPYRGVGVFKFPSDKKCVDAGTVNGKWITRPKFSVHPHLKVVKSITIPIRIAIEPFSGTVLAAKTVGGDPLVRKTLESQALNVKFHPMLINSKPFLVKGVIKLTILPSGEVRY